MKAFVVAAAVACFSLSGAWLLAYPIQKWTRPATAQVPSAVSLQELVSQGQQYFGESCSQCHGDDATGDEGPNLHQLPVSNAYIRTMVKNGLKGEMPSFAKKYDDQQVGAIVAYLRSLGPVP